MCSDSLFFFKAHPVHFIMGKAMLPDCGRLEINRFVILKNCLHALLMN